LETDAIETKKVAKRDEKTIFWGQKRHKNGDILKIMTPISEKNCIFEIFAVTLQHL